MPWKAVLLALGFGGAVYGGVRLALQEPYERLSGPHVQPSEFKMLSANIATEVPTGTDWLDIALLGGGSVTFIAGLLAHRRGKRLQGST